jgi:hypothetical protein
MVSKYDYAWEKLLVAVQSLSTSNLPLRERLADAYVSSLIRLRGNPEHHFPIPLLERWGSIEQALQASIATSVAGMQMHQCLP